MYNATFIPIVFVPKWHLLFRNLRDYEANNLDRVIVHNMHTTQAKHTSTQIAVIVRPGGNFRESPPVRGRRIAESQWSRIEIGSAAYWVNHLSPGGVTYIPGSAVLSHFSLASRRVLRSHGEHTHTLSSDPSGESGSSPPCIRDVRVRVAPDHTAAIGDGTRPPHSGCLCRWFTGQGNFVVSHHRISSACPSKHTFLCCTLLSQGWLFSNRLLNAACRRCIYL